MASPRTKRPPRMELHEAYAAIRRWYRSHRSSIRGGNEDYRAKSLLLIDALPEPQQISELEIVAIFREVLTGLLEWGYTQSDGNLSMAEYARAALETNGRNYDLSKDEEATLRNTPLWRFLRSAYKESPSASQSSSVSSEDYSQVTQSSKDSIKGANRETSTIPLGQTEAQNAVRSESIDTASVSDQPTTDDTLGFSPYVEAIGRFLLSRGTKPPLTLSVEGEWGSGKSSFMRQLRKWIDARRATSRIGPQDDSIKGKTFTVWFNAWRHDKGEALWAAFALEFVDQISSSMNLRQRCSAAWTLARTRYDWSAGWWDVLRAITISLIWMTLALTGIYLWWAGAIPASEILSGAGIKTWAADLIQFVVGSSGVMGCMAAFFYMVRQINSIVGNPLKHELKKHLKDLDYSAKIAFIEKFHRDFSKIVRAYAGDARVFVFVDDLDRCEIPTAAELLQALNLMIADEDHIIFVLGLDREKVAAGLAARHEKLLPYLVAQEIRGSTPNTPLAGVEYGLSFIEKFIQLPFRVPLSGPEQLDKFLSGLRNPNEFPNRSELLQSASSATSGEKARASASNPQSRDSSASETRNADSRWKGFELRVSHESETIQQLVQIVAPALDYNPRRLKQFVNAFRLKAYICFDTGLFNPRIIDSQTSPLTFEQLGKFVAISLRWPMLLNDLYDDPSILARLSTTRDKTDMTPIELYWRQRARLMDLIHSAGKDAYADEKMSDRYSLRMLDVRALLRSSPRVIREVPVSQRRSTPKPETPPVVIAPQSSSTRDDDFNPRRAFHGVPRRSEMQK